MNDFDPTEYEGDPYEDFTLTAQQQHDVMACRRKGKLQPGSKQRLVKLLKAKETAFDPIAGAMLDNPGLTRDEAERHARALGF
ncbi:hypothetical protein [Limnohabitans sp. Bal53]|uniref:hypothetical protein n=1 Tax=Limnohabitans sp. Bal53 TaxID=1977910 RepID=UPI000D348F88|nr:hypothetical protein [Limnohabitans sp. Bal53]PUE41434.1 hypothetical protein B9Z50_06930 [Limnohabitans sp. Bal53]